MKLMPIFAGPLLAIDLLFTLGCGVEEEITLSPNPPIYEALESDKQPLTDTRTESNAININNSEVREGLQYLKGSEIPYTGKVFTLAENGIKKTEGSFKDGKKHGLWTEWSEDGTWQRDQFWRHGKGGITK